MAMGAKEKPMFRQYTGVAAAGAVIGLVAVCLGIFGNPGNMAFCVACFIRDTAGALGLHRAEAALYARPEIIGIVLGSLLISLAKKEYASKGGSSPFIRFILGICVMVGALVFLGCPLRMVLRIAGGDLNAAIGLAGFAAGILTGVLFLKKGFTLKQPHDQPAIEGLGLPFINALILAALVAAPALLLFSETGPGSMRAPLLMSLAGGLVVGIAAQRSRLCFVGGIRDAALFRDFKMLTPFAAIFVTVLIGNLITGKFNLGMEGQPTAHTEWLWNILGLYLVGVGSVLLGGCPLRQLVMAGGGNSDAGVTVLGFLVGAAICHNFGLASSAAGTTRNGRVAFVICAAIVFGIAIANTVKAKAKRPATAAARQASV